MSVIGEPIGSYGELAAFVTEATDTIAERIHTVAERRADDVLDVGFYEVAELIDRCDDATLDRDELHRHPCVVSASTRWRDTVTDDGYLIVVGEDTVTGSPAPRPCTKHTTFPKPSASPTCTRGRRAAPTPGTTSG